MSDTMQELLELVEDNKGSMNDAAYLNLVNGLQELYKRTNGSYTTDYRQMYFDERDKHLELDRVVNLFKDGNSITVLKKGGKVKEQYRRAVMSRNSHQPDFTSWSIAERTFHEPKEGTPDTIIYHHGNDYTERWHRDGKLHRDGDLPAQVEYMFLSDGRHTIKYWYVNGKLHRDNDKPAIVSEAYDGTIDLEEWHVNGKFHRDGDQPAEINYNGDSGYYHAWYQHGKQCREGDKPIYVYFYKDGTIKNEQWITPRAGDKPDSIKYYEDGKVRTEQWFSRENDKPTKIRYNRDGSCEKLWYKNGNLIKKLVVPKITPKSVSKDRN